jgi:allantoicase
VILPGRGKDMGDGWETARSRTPGHVDWAIFRLGLAGTVHKIVVDTKDFRGNYPREVRVHGINLSKATTTTTHGKDEELHLTNDYPGWIELLSGAKKTEADTEHVYEGADLAAGPNDERVFTHVKLTLIPDGGVKRFRIFGKRAM